ncbi:PEPxxWA-CTERM sorting domain-containing protein [Sphingomonas folli]|uniref:PEPxxWA-CTERM sorting domain-containing protein n=1 Tax=Sphingomonas folli TaxID=2862497 RepID=UPI001CA4D0F1|nr:PEPxxWA-CTERM sorting domain-containing protein [Sphingomonas folli]
MKKEWTLALGALGLFAAQPAAADRNTAQFTSVTVFGDSLVDAGNLYIANGGTRPDPSQGYFQNRFTDGFDYPDLISLKLFGEPTKPSLAGGNNYAFGGARVVNTGDSIPDLGAQLSTFAASGKAIDPNGLYILNFGGNDVFGAEGVFGPVGAIGDYPDVSSYLKAAANQYVAGIKALNDRGARNILFTDFPNAADPLTIEANGYLRAALSGLSVSAGTDLFFYSLSEFNVGVLTRPDRFGLPPLRTDTDCVAAGAQASGCAGFFSFDGVHVTGAVQAAGFRDMDQRFGLTSAVPEPSVWAMLILGFGLVGAALRRGRPRRAALAR